MYSCKPLCLNLPTQGGKESPAAKSLRHTETNLCHRVHEPPPYNIQASAIQNEFIKTLVYVFKKRYFFMFFNAVKSLQIFIQSLSQKFVIHHFCKILEICTKFLENVQ